MSMIMQYARIRDAGLVELRRLLVEAPDEAYDFVDDLADQDADSTGSEPRGMDTDNAWAAIDYLLSQHDARVDVIIGGTAMTEDAWGYDAPRLFTSHEVVSASRFLDETPFAQLAPFFVPAELMRADVYPKIWDEEGVADFLADVYTRLVMFFRAAAAEGDNIVIWMS
jgi:Domain of unknown function (DUF1877)